MILMCRYAVLSGNYKNIIVAMLENLIRIMNLKSLSNKLKCYYDYYETDCVASATSRFCLLVFSVLSFVVVLSFAVCNISLNVGLEFVARICYAICGIAVVMLIGLPFIALFHLFLDARRNIKEMKEKLIQGAGVIDVAIKSNFPVFARWCDACVQILSVKYENRDGEDHLFGYDAEGKEYWIVGAVIECHHSEGIKFVWSLTGEDH
jgi:hypothetical protein